MFKESVTQEELRTATVRAQTVCSTSPRLSFPIFKMGRYFLPCDFVRIGCTLTSSLWYIAWHLVRPQTHLSPSGESGFRRSFLQPNPMRHPGLSAHLSFTVDRARHGARCSPFLPPSPLASGEALLKAGKTLINVQRKEMGLAAESLDE